MIGAAIATFVAAHSGHAVSLIALAVMQFFVTGTAPVLWSTAMSRINGVQAAAGLGMINSIGPLGGFFGPNLFGIAESRTGNPASAIALLTIAAFIGLLVAGPLRWFPVVKDISVPRTVRDRSPFTASAVPSATPVTTSVS